MKGKRFLIFCNQLGESLFSTGIELLSEMNDVQIIIRDDSYSTDLRSSGYSLLRALKKIACKHREAALDKIMSEQIKGSYDYFVVIGYYQVSSDLLSIVRKKNPNCKFIIYFYDSFCRLNFSNDIKLFDSCFTYDRLDAEKYHINYLPLFVEEYPKRPLLYDMCHIGAWSPGHVYRVPVLSQIMKQMPELSYYFKCPYQDLDSFPFQRKIIFLIRSIFNKDYRLYKSFYSKYKTDVVLSDSKIPYSTIIEKEAASKCVVEINAKRAGLSPRVLNALANGKKVIINNPFIMNEKFYNPSNVLIIDEANLLIKNDFLDTPVEFCDLSDLKIASWLDILFGNKNNRYNCSIGK